MLAWCLDGHKAKKAWIQFNLISITPKHKSPQGHSKVKTLLNIAQTLAQSKQQKLTLTEETIQNIF